jgi:hypothetical protein
MWQLGITLAYPTMPACRLTPATMLTWSLGSRYSIGAFTRECSFAGNIYLSQSMNCGRMPAQVEFFVRNALSLPKQVCIMKSGVIMLIDVWNANSAHCVDGNVGHSLLDPHRLRWPARRQRQHRDEQGRGRAAGAEL